ncbi:hypothetical protein AYO21_09511 [Fonsecaea monophora]|uniref:Uncharacterized protein n=1 Tax=Fonsecaea monophora TaxID=254056 RepID=A0A177EZ99_9EURO|nr:hypothetical protein AYO21_09511 [Fonsecaea monophora]OAG36269.1 hypothetical protein AYO21_09511 [Fonsecaea monophora]
MAYILRTLLACQEGMCRRSDGTYPYNSKHTAYDGFIDILLTASSEITLTSLRPNLTACRGSGSPSRRAVRDRDQDATATVVVQRFSEDLILCMAGMPLEGGASDARRAEEEEEEDVPMPDAWHLNKDAKALGHPQVFSTAKGFWRQEVGKETYFDIPHHPSW